MTGIRFTTKWPWLKPEKKQSASINQADSEGTLDRWYIESLKSEIDFLRKQVINGYEERKRLNDHLEKTLIQRETDLIPEIPFDPALMQKIVPGIELPSEKRKRLTLEAYEKMRAAKKQVVEEEEGEDSNG